MSKQFTNRYLQGIFEPLDSEYNIENCIVNGQIPKELNGSLYKIGSNPQFVYSANYHLFGGDGMIHKIDFNNGVVSYANRWVRTNKFNQEKEAKKALYAGFRDEEILKQIMNGMFADTVNTNVIYHAGKLLALNESVTPYSVDLELNTLHKYNFSGKLDGSMTAHPRICPETGELVMFSYLSRDIDGKTINYYVADKNGKIIHKTEITVPYKSLMHDFAIAGDYVIFPLFPLTCSLAKLLNGEEFYTWESDLGCYFGIMPRLGNSDDCIWIHQSEAGLAMHIANAYQENNLLIIDACYADNIPKDANGFKPGSEEEFPAYLTRFIFDIVSKKLVEKIKLDTVACEFPKFDERYTGKKYNHAYVASILSDHWEGHEFNAIMHYDLSNNQKQVHDFGINAMPLEPIFVPKNSNSSEGEGFLLVFVYNKLKNRSDLVILDAQNVDKEPLATVKLPHRVPFTFHGTFVPRCG